MRNQRLIEALLRTQAAMGFCREKKPAPALKSLKAAKESLALAPEYLKESQETLRQYRLICARLEYAEDELRAGLPATDTLRVAHAWIAEMIVGQAMPGQPRIPAEIGSDLACSVCGQAIGKDETVYANSRGGFTCKGCLSGVTR